MESMNLSTEEHRSTVSVIDDELFAYHALACIAVHDSPRNVESGKTLGDIVSQDDLLKHELQTIRVVSILSFGKYNVNLLRGFLKKIYKRTDADIDGFVNRIAGQLTERVF